MPIFKNTIADVIRCEEQSYLIWKWKPSSGAKNRENAVRWGSSLHIKDGEAVIFVYSDKNGVHHDYITGPYDGFLNTVNFPVLSGIMAIPYGGNSPFPAEIYFINLAGILQSRFAVPYFDVFDPIYSEYSVPVSVRGTISFRLSDINDFIRLYKLQSFNLDDFRSVIRDSVARYVKSVVANAPRKYQLPVIQLESALQQINDDLHTELSNKVMHDFGIYMVRVDVGNIEIDKSSSDYTQLVAITKDITAAKVDAQKEDYIESLRIQREESQYALHKQTQTANIQAMQIEKQAEMVTSGAEAISKNRGGSGAEQTWTTPLSNPASLIAEMAIGGAIGKSFSGTIQNVLDSSHSTATTPPPLPTTQYFIAIDGKASGPFNTESFKQMALNGKLTKQSLVWTEGLPNWMPADTIPELSAILAKAPPPIPQA